MWLSPKSSSLMGGLLRLAACWMTVVLLMQGFAAGYARALGPVHHHVQPQRSLGLWSHGDATAQAHAHAQAHHSNQRHHHDAGDASVQRAVAQEAADEAWDAAVSALVAALALLAVSLRLRRFAPGRPVWRAAISWACLSAPVAPPLKPPQIALI
jgi:hypothetical protein